MQSGRPTIPDQQNENVQAVASKYASDGDGYFLRNFGDGIWGEMHGNGRGAETDWDYDTGEPCYQYEGYLPITEVEHLLSNNHIANS
jgi:hypothetical protein